MHLHLYLMSEMALLKCGLIMRKSDLGVLTSPG